MALSVIDASVLIAVLDGAHVFHDIAERALSHAASQGNLVVPSIAFAEVLVLPYRRGQNVGETVEMQLRALGEVMAVDEHVASLAAQLRARRDVKLPDALIIAAGMLRNAEILTLDRRWATIDPRVRVIS